MKRFLIFIFLSVFGLSTSAQTPQIDSIRRLVVRAKSDREHIDLQNELVSRMNQVNLDTAIVMGKNT